MNGTILGGFLTPFVSSASSILIFLVLEKNRFKTSVSALIAAITILISTLSGGIVFIYFGKSHYISSIVLTLLLPLIISEFILSGQRNSKTVFTILTTSVLSFAGTTPILLLALYLHSGVFLYNILRIIMFVFIIAALMFFVQKPYRKIQKEIEKGWLIFCVLPAFEVIVNFSLIAIFPGKWGVLIPTSLILLLLLFAIYAIFYYVFMQLRGKYDLLERERLMLMQNYYGKLLLEQQEKSIEKIQHLRHDMRHYVRTALSMMEHGNITDAAEQFTRFLKNVDNVPLKSFCDNKTANYVFSYFAEKAKNENINFGIESVIPDECGIDSVDLGGILSNLLENAVEGCLRISDVSLRSIRLSCTKNDSIMLIRSENSCVQEIIFKDDMPVSSKESGGIGTQSIMRAVQMYNGIADFSVKDGTFFVKIILHGK